jgi:DNA anti-recombination protein RmuC
MPDILERYIAKAELDEMDRMNRQFEIDDFRRKQAREESERKAKAERDRVERQRQNEANSYTDRRVNSLRDEVYTAFREYDRDYVRSHLEEIFEAHNKTTEDFEDGINKAFDRIRALEAQIGDLVEENKSLHNEVTGLRGIQDLTDRRMTIARGEAVLSRGEIKSLRQNWSESGARNLTLVRRKVA